ncbi:alkaline phosphatase family protein [bacterium]|nr:alkaline phosphatase family protein [bacterium]
MSDQQVKTIVLVDVDGLRRDVLYHVLAKGNESLAPNLHRIFGEITFKDHIAPSLGDLLVPCEIQKATGVVVNKCITVSPSYTHPCQASLFTGLYPRNHGITANFPFDRRGRSLAAMGREKNFSSLDAIRFYDAIGSANQMLRQGTQTIYDHLAEQHLKSAIVFQFFSTQNENMINPSSKKNGAKPIDWIKPQVDEMILSQIENPDDYQECIIAKIFPQKPLFDDAMMDKAIELIEQIDRTEQVPNLLTLYFAGHDHFAHQHASAEDQEKYLMDHVDRCLGRFLTTLSSKEDVVDLKHTLFIICSDHGHTGIADADKRFIKARKVSDILSACGIDTQDKKKEFLKLPMDDSTCLIKDTAGLMHIFIRGGSSADPSWAQPPDASQVQSLLHSLCTKVKEQNHSEKDNMSGIGNQLLQGIDAILFHDHEQNNYQTYYLRHGPFSQGAPIAETLSQGVGYLPMKTYIDEMTCENSGDIILIPRYLDGFRFESKEATNSTHGSLATTDMLVPLIFSCPYNHDLVKQLFAGNSHVIEQARNVDLTPTILDLFHVCGTGCDGKSLLR